MPAVSRKKRSSAENLSENGSAAEVTHPPRLPEAAFPEHEAAAAERGDSGAAEEASRSRDGSVTEPLCPQEAPAPGSKLSTALGGLLARDEWIRCCLVVTLVLAVLLCLVLGVALAVCSARSAPEAPVLLLGCPEGWVGYNGTCYFLSGDHRTWDQAQDRCSELGASLAVLRDEEMEFALRLCGNADHWLGLRRRGRGLQWVDGSDFSSSVKVPGSAECAFLGEGGLGSALCANEMRYLCSAAHTCLQRGAGGAPAPLPAASASPLPPARGCPSPAAASASP